MEAGLKSQQEQLRHTLEAHYDILRDLEYIRDCATWVSQNYLDKQVIPIPEINGRQLFLRDLYLNALLILYRRCFDRKQRGRLDLSRIDEVLSGGFKEVHVDELIARANQLVAHPISAASATSIRIGRGRQILPSSIRPGVNKFDFDNLVALVERWIPFVQSEITHLSEELRLHLSGQEDEGNEIFAVPWGSGIDIQSLRRRNARGKPDR